MRIALAGFGVVGRALARALVERGPRLRADYGLEPRLVAIRDSRSLAADVHGLDPAALVSTKEATGSVGSPLPKAFDAAAWARSTPADVYIDTTPTDLRDPRPSLNGLLAALGSGKHAVTVNKAPLAVAMPALLENARHNGRLLRFSGTVGAGTPVLATASTLARGDTITSVEAILNGTTNFILWLMATSASPFGAALAEAQRLGYAEADPGNDVDGFDTAMKLVILANHAMGLSVGVDRVSITGIRAVTAQQIAEAAAAGDVIKLIGAITAEGKLSVAPRRVSAAGPLNVPRNLNAVRFSLASGGEPTLVGRGAGGPETATAIIRDLIDIHTANTGVKPC
jgi:homoserine dehydrogenase